jgi:UDP-N-acetylmuramoyl-tripeptide--D-alanyl-D-alanine ligase
MIKISAKEFAQIVSGEIVAIADDEVLNQSPVINSKIATADNFFAAFVGENADGHDYVAEALSNGAKFALVSKRVSQPSILVKMLVRHFYN